MNLKRLSSLVLASMLCAFVVHAQSSQSSQSSITISLDTRHPGAAISPEFTGLSFELSLLLPDSNGARYFRPDNQPLINLFQTFGIKNLRVGGNSADRNA